MLYNDVIMISSPIKNYLVHNYVDHELISIRTKFRTTISKNEYTKVNSLLHAVQLQKKLHRPFGFCFQIY